MVINPSIAAVMGGPELSARDATVEMPDVPDLALLTVMVDDRHPDEVVDGVARFAQLVPGPHTLHWTYGADCSPDTCPGDSCHSWCGASAAAVTVDEGEGDAVLELPRFSMPTRTVTVRVKSLENPRRGWFKRRAARQVRGWLGDLEATVSESDLVFEQVPPGRHNLRIDLGLCEDATGCWPDGECPDDCISELQPLEVGWGSAPLIKTSDLPLPD